MLDLTLYGTGQPQTYSIRGTCMPDVAAPRRVDSLIAGLLYLATGITGGLAFMAVRPQLTGATGVETLAILQQQTSLARTGVALESATALFQSLTAIWFVRLFRDVDLAAANAVALFGMVNALAVLASSVMVRAALDAAIGPVVADGSIVHLHMLTSARFWDAGSLFFGLWLLPMGWLVLKSGFGPRPLGWILLFGGTGYIATAFVGILAPDAGLWIAILPLLATVGEFWMIGLLIWNGLRRTDQMKAAA